MLSRIAGVLVVCVAVSTPASADLTMKQKTGGKAMGRDMAGESVQSIKGTKMRTDQTFAGTQTSTIIDAATQRMIVLNHSRKEADVHDLTQFAGDMSKVGVEDIKASVTPSGQTRQIAGVGCAVHDMKVSVPMQMGADQLTIVMSGPVCLVKGGPGAADYAAFYKAASEKGLFFGDPRTAKAQPGQAKGMTQLYREMADRGVPYATDITVAFEGSGMMASMMTKIGGATMTTEVVSISSDSIPDAMFEVPAGYKERKR